MNNIAVVNPSRSSTAKPQPTWVDSASAAVLIVLAAALLLTAVALSTSFYNGRLAAPMTHDDVNWFISGIQHLTLLRNQGFFALAATFLHESLHAPVAVYQAMFAYLIFGITDWAPYASNFVWVLAFFGFAAYLLRDCPRIVLGAALACLIALPLSAGLVTEFAPETVCSLFTAIGAVLMVRLPLFGVRLRTRCFAAGCFAVAFLAHPTAVPFTLIALLASVGVALLREIVWMRKFSLVPSALASALLNVLLSVLVPALYLVPRYADYANYFYNAIFDPAMRGVWYSEIALHQSLRFYLTGIGGQFMFDHKLWTYVVIVGLGFAAAWRNKDRRSLGRQGELLLLAFLFWLVPTLAEAKQYLFASAFGFVLAFMTVIALRSIYEAIRGASGAIVVSAIAVLLLMLYRPASMTIPNLPQTTADRDFAFDAINRFKADLLGNAVDDHGTKVYMTNMGGYAPNILQYYMLKTNPTFDWVFDTKWQDPNPSDHLDFIHNSRQDFVIAGQRGNGLTYSPFAWPAEDAVFAALWRDPGYMAIDRFYGPGGREIAVFQRRADFAGWRAVSGMADSSQAPDAPRNVPGGLAYLQTFAARPVEADLEIDWAGASAGQRLSIIVNYKQVAESTFDPTPTTSSLKQEISLSHGTNDIVLRSSGPLTVRSLLIVPHIAAKTPS